ncbi:MAG: AAA family ATPase [Anaerolineaceae bacterium]|nr:AAA family ATPase [Anaerolineaceae bacterium]
MAHILPETLPQTLPSEVLKTFRALKNLPDTFFIWHHLAPWQPNAPDFLMITQMGQALLIKVSSSTVTKGVPAAQLLLLDDHQPKLGMTESVTLSTFSTSLSLPDDTPLEMLIIFPNIAHTYLLESRIENNTGEPQWAGRELLQPDSPVKWESYFSPIPIKNIFLEKIRQFFTPEILVSANMTVRPNDPQRMEAGLTDYLLDYNQEAAVKADLFLESEGQKISTDFRLGIINGVAGSGKTLILLYRLRLLYHLYPEKNFLVLTHNRPLSHDIQGRFYQMVGYLPENIEWRTFNAWCYHNWPDQPAWKEPLSIKKRKRLIKEVWQKYFQDCTITEQMLLSEIDWLKDQSPIDHSEYLSIDRRGRGFRLTFDQREIMWSAIKEYQRILIMQDSMDWGDVSQHLWKFIKEKKIVLPQYDFIMVDEAQFFAPIWFSLILKALKPNNSHLFLVADPTQGFLRRKNTWKSLGLEARGRTHRLQHSYRTTREIMQFATMFYRLRMTDEKDDDVLVPDMLNMPNGVIPQIITLANSQGEISRVANEVVEFLKQGYPRRHLLLLHANGQGVQSLIKTINHRTGNNVAMDPKNTFPGNFVRVTTLNAGAGLESPIVFLIGLRELFEQEQSIRLSDEEREEIIRDVTRKVYMAATRAGQRLIFTYVGDLPNVMKQLFTI